MGILDLFFPKFCASCRKAGSYLCTDCFSRLSFDTRLPCSECNRGTFNGLTHPGCRRTYGLDGMFASLVYTKPVKKLIYEFKYKPYVSDLRDLLASLFIEGIIQEELFITSLSPLDIFVPIPLHAKKLRQRGFNHAKLLSESLSLHFGNTSGDILKRQKQTISQFGLTREKRKENVKNAFTLKNTPSTKTIFLVDDIVTSGSTFVEAARVLKRGGVERVYGIALAHGR